MKCYKCKVEMEEVLTNQDGETLFHCPQCGETEWEVEG